MDDRPVNFRPIRRKQLLPKLTVGDSEADLKISQLKVTLMCVQKFKLQVAKVLNDIETESKNIILKIERLLKSYDTDPNKRD